MPIYLMFIGVLLSVEFCFTLKTYLKGAPFYNASASRKSELHHASAGHESETRYFFSRHCEHTVNCMSISGNDAVSSACSTGSEPIPGTRRGFELPRTEARRILSPLLAFANQPIFFQLQ